MATDMLQRASSQYDPLTELSSTLIVGPSNRKYDLQYSSLYDFRLRKLKHPKGRLLAAATRRWTEGILEEETVGGVKEESQASTSSSTSANHLGGRSGSSRKRTRGPEESLPTAHYVKRILDIKQGQICFVIGTIYCSMHLKPDVLEDLTREQWLPPQPLNERYADPDKDEFYIEDESGRVRLVGDTIAADGEFRDTLVTGIVVAILGTETRSGDFEVADVIFPGIPAPSAPKTRVKEEAMDVDGQSNDEEQWVAIVSGLEIEPSRSSIKVESESGKRQEKAAEQSDESDSGMIGYAEREVKLMMLTDWLLGMSNGTAEEQEDAEKRSASRVSNLIIAGNSIAPLPKVDDDRVSSGPRNAPSGPPAPKDSYPTSSFDDFLSDLTASMHVHLLPGQRDPTSLAMPQQPIHFAFFPKSAQFAGLHRETNPAWFGIGGKRFVGTSGQNVDDVFKYMIEGDGPQARLRAACQTLDWAHVAPTAPDTLSCYPFNDRDPFLIEEAPDVYFIGNQDAFATHLYKGTQGHLVRVVMIPRFRESGSVVLVNPKTLACKLIDVGIEAF